MIVRSGTRSAGLCIRRLMSHPGALLMLFLMAMGSQCSSLAAEVAPTKGGELPVVGAGGAEAEVVIDYFSGDVIRNAATALVAEIQRRTGVALPLRCGEPTPGKVAIYVGTVDQSALLKKALASLGLQPVTADDPGKEGFLLTSGKKEGEAGIVVINGCDDLGSFHGVGWLLRKMRFPEGRALVPVGLNISAAPVTRQRGMSCEQNAGYANADIDGLREIWTDYIFWGLQSIRSSCDPAQQGDPRESDFSRYLWDKWAALVRLTQSLGLGMRHGTQVNMVAKEGEFGPAQIPNFAELNYMACNSNGVNPKFPRAMEVLKASRKWFFEHLPYADEIAYLTSGWDTGGVHPDPELGPWSLAYGELVDTMIAPLIFERNPDAKIVMKVYFVPEFKLLAEKMNAGWHPESVYGFQFGWTAETDWAYLVPEQYKRFYQPMWCSDFFFYGAIGANPRPGFCESEFNAVWNRGVRDGTGAYSEGVHEYVNQIIILQKAWDPKQPMDEILDEICRYYFGEEAAPIVKEAFLLMEPEEPEILDDPKIDPRVQKLVAQAEPLLPSWAKSSRQWAVVVGRAGIDRTRRRQADLLASFDQRWQEYESLLKPDATRSANVIDGQISYFQSVADNAWELERIYKRMDRDGFGVQGGNQIAPVWPDPRTGEAIEALTALRQMKANIGPVVPTRWCVAFVDQNAQVCVSDGWSNLTTLHGPQAADAQLAVAHLGGGHNEVVFLATDGRLSRWNPLEASAGVLAEGEFLSGPLARGDLNGDGRDELVVLTGPSEQDSSLAVVDAQGKTFVLKARSSGQPPDVATNGIVLLPPNPPQTAKTNFEPRVRVCDVDGDGQLEIAYADRDEGDRLAVVGFNGQRRVIGPSAPAGVMANADLDGDGLQELVYLDASGYLAAFSAKKGVLNLGERIRPKWKSSMVGARIDRDRLPEVVYADQDGYLYGIGLGRASRRLTDISNNTMTVGPGLVTGDFNGDGREDVCCLRSHRWWDRPLATLSYVDETQGYRDFSVSSRHMQSLSYAAPLGPRAAGPMSVPAVHKSYAMEHGRVYKINWYNCGELDPIFESYTVQERKKKNENN